MPERKVLIVEDHPLFAKGLVQLINSQPSLKVVGEVHNGNDALQALDNLGPDLAIVDLNLGEEDGLSLINSMKSRRQETIILVLSMHEERYYAERALRAGARGYIMKSEASTRVLDAVQTVLAGKVWISEREKEHLLEHMAGGQSLKEGKPWLASVQSLSPRQLQIFQLIGKGWGTIEIATKFNISVKTVDTHKANLKDKLHCASSQQLRQLAIEWTRLSG